VSQVHRTTDWQPDCSPWWTTATGGGRSLLECELTGIPVHGTSPCGEQENGTGIPSPVGTRRRRGSDGRASAKGGGGGASSVRWCSGCGGEGRRGAASTVSRGGGESAFYREGG
jgi:hypothetical protein